MKKTRENEDVTVQETEENEVLSRLAERVERAVATISELRKERDQLRARVEELSSELKMQTEEGERLSTVEQENAKYREERDTIRTRIETMLRNLETLDEAAAE